MDTVAIFCALDDFCQWFEPWWEQRLLELAPKRRRRRGGRCLSEVMTILGGFRCRVTGPLSTITWVKC
jgi:hypothetical protein